MEKIIGIYKIISPSGKVYVGQTIDFQKRIENYKYYNCKNQRKLCHSFIKYGFDKHQFEIIEKCEIDQLNKRERYFQEFYNSIEKGLNCKYSETSDKTGKLSEETKRMISISSLKKEISIYDIDGNYIQSFKSLKECSKVLSITSASISAALKGNIHLLKNLYQVKYGINVSKIESYKEEREYNWKNKPEIHWTWVKIKCIEDDLIFNSISECADYYKVKRTSIQNVLSGKSKKLKNGKTFIRI